MIPSSTVAFRWIRSTAIAGFTTILMSDVILATSGLTTHSVVPQDNEERRAGIVRLLSEAYCIRLKRQEKDRISNENPLAATTRYDFLR